MTALWAGHRPIRDVGVGLRSCHYQTILCEQPDIAWFEILADNYLKPSGIPISQLIPICERYPVVIHSVGMSLGSVDPINWDYLKQLRCLAERIHPAWISDHLCWISTEQDYLQELMPLPYTDEAVNHVAQRIKQIQDFLGQRILIENVSSYMAYKHSCLSEWEFLTAVAESADCYILLDINNIYVSAFNHQFDPQTYLHHIPPSRVKQLHLAGYEDCQTHLLDTHGDKVQTPVWELYRHALNYLGPVPTLIEWDNNIPEWLVLTAEAERARAVMETVVLAES